jgi:hypothetical protein
LKARAKALVEASRLAVGAHDVALGVLAAYLRGLTIDVRIMDSCKGGQSTYDDRASVEFLTLLSADDIALAVLAADLEKACLDLDLALLGADLVALGVLATHFQEASLDLALGVGADLVALAILAAHLGRDGLGVGANLVALAVLAADDRGEDHRLGVSAHLVSLGVLAANDRRLRVQSVRCT